MAFLLIYLNTKTGERQTAPPGNHICDERTRSGFDRAKLENGGSGGGLVFYRPGGEMQGGANDSPPAAPDQQTRATFKDRANLAKVVVLVVEGAPEALTALADSQSFLVIGDVSRPEQASGKSLITLLTLLAVIALVVSGLTPVVTAAVAGCAVLVLTKCLRLRELYGAVNLSIVFLLAGSRARAARRSIKPESPRSSPTL